MLGQAFGYLAARMPLCIPNRSFPKAAISSASSQTKASTDQVRVRVRPFERDSYDLGICVSAYLTHDLPADLHMYLPPDLAG